MMPIKLPKERKDELIREVKAYFEEERSEPIGDLAAEQWLDFMIRLLGPYLYNKGVADARTLVGQKMAAFEDELYALEKPIPRNRN